LAVLAGTLVQAQSNAGRTCPTPGFDARPWLEDFDQLTTEMAAHYSDLEYAIEGRHMDLPELRRETEATLGASCSESEAKQALQSFLRLFGDGHLGIEWAERAAQATPEKTAPLCSRLGYKKWALNPGIDFSQLPQFSSVGGDGAGWFPGGILKLSENERLGVIRIAIFSEHAFPDACEEVVQSMHLADSDKCDQECKNKVGYKTGDLLTAALLRRSAQLQSAGASAILVDITHNDGGSDWVDSVVRALSRTPLRESPYGFIKHEHWTRELQERLADVETDLKQGKEPKDLLRLAAERLRSGIARSQEKCDRSGVWKDGKLTCSLVVSGLLYSSGVLPYAEPGSLATLESRSTLFHPLDYTYTESSARPRLYVVVDAHTWSSAEYFSFLLQDNSAATILGEVTGGAGCGFTNGGIPTTLRNSRATVKMPDCVHFRKDGSNANAGVTPDFLVPWSSHDNSYLKAEKLFRSLGNVVSTRSKEPRHETHS
jgi:hypothetical protein